jgi:hypothetical protein
VLWTVGVTDTVVRNALGTFDSEDAAAEFIETLPDHENGKYYLDCPSENTLIRTEFYPATRIDPESASWDCRCGFTLEY